MILMLTERLNIPRREFIMKPLLEFRYFYFNIFYDRSWDTFFHLLKGSLGTGILAMYVYLF